MWSAQSRWQSEACPETKKKQLKKGKLILLRWIVIDVLGLLRFFVVCLNGLLVGLGYPWA